jgi:aminoglycoside phosphotransferase family enzyme
MCQFIVVDLNLKPFIVTNEKVVRSKFMSTIVDHIQQQMTNKLFYNYRTYFELKCQFLIGGVTIYRD